MKAGTSGRRHRSLRARIVLLTLGGVLVPSAVLGWLSWRAIESLRQQVLAEREQLSASIAAYADAQVRPELEQLYEIATSLGGLPGYPAGGARVALHEAYLRSHLFTQVFLLDRAAKQILAEPEESAPATPSPGELAAVRATLSTATPQISPLMRNTAGAWRLYVLVPVGSWNQQVIGVVGGAIDPSSRRFRSLLNFVPPAAGETIDLVDRNGTVIATTGTHPLYVKSRHRRVLAQLIAEQRREVGTCHSCHQEGTTLQRIKDVMAFAPLSRAVGWGISIRQPRALELATVDALRWRLFASMPALFLLALLFALGAAASVTGPLSALSGMAKRMAAGEMDSPVPALGSDEVGQLGTALEQMRIRLRESIEEVARARDELESRVRQRTQEVEQLLTQLRQQDEIRAKLLRKVITAQEEERRRIARELHDQTSQVVAALTLSLDTARATMLEGNSRQLLDDAKTLAVQTLAGIQKMSFDLRPSALDDLGLFPAIEWYAARHLKPLGINVRCEFDENVGGRLPTEVETALFRAVQEALTNVVKHAHAETVLIQAARQAGAVIIEIEDDGQGFDLAGLSPRAEEGRGLGLAGIRERAELLGGTAQIESAPGEGTRVVLTIPLEGKHG